MDLYTAMIRMIEELAKLRLPIVFKGAMTLSQLLRMNGEEHIRGTRDIDANWIFNVPSMSTMTEFVQQAASAVDKEYTVTSFRDYGEGMSAGFEVTHATNSELNFTIDISVGENNGCMTYITDVNSVTFNASSPIKMAADKVNAISSRKIFRRVKDVLDLYQLSYLFGFNTREILDATDGKMLGYKAITEAKEHIEHAYDKLKVNGNKPEFEIVYNRVIEFLKPFIDSGYEAPNLDWDGEQWKSTNT